MTKRVRIHGRPPTHDHVEGVEGSHANAVAELAASTPPPVVETTIVRSSFRELADLAAWLRARGVQRWELTFASATGRFAADPRPWIPRLALAVPHALVAIDRARRTGIDATIAGVPRCLLGPHGDWRRPIPARAFAPRCEGCAARDDCDGLDAWYLARYGAAELRPLRATGT